MRAVERLAKYLKHSPEKATSEQLRQFQIELVAQGASSGTINATITGIQFLYCKTLDQPDTAKRLCSVPTPRKLPNVLSINEVKRLIDGCRSPKYRTALSVAYGAGLRISEVVALKVSDIDSDRMVLNVEQGKGKNAMVHHPHVHCIVPGGGIKNGEQQWQACKKGFFLPVRVLSRLFRRLFVEGLKALFADERLLFFSELNELDDTDTFAKWCTKQQSREWVVYAKKPFAGPKAVLAYLARYTHRVAISNSRLREINDNQVTFTYKDYRRKGDNRHKTMQLDTDEFIRRFMLHVLPSGFHRIRHFGLLASRPKLALARKLLEAPAPEVQETFTKAADEPAVFICRKCQQPLEIMAIKEPVYLPRAPPKSN